MSSFDFVDYINIAVSGERYRNQARSTKFIGIVLTMAILSNYIRC